MKNLLLLSKEDRAVSRYAVLLHAQGLKLLNQDGQPAPAGAYSWRVVEAETPHEAEDLARSKLLSDEVFLAEIWNPPDEPPEIAVDEVSELESPSGGDSGCVFYFEDENDAPYGSEGNKDDQALT